MGHTNLTTVINSCNDHLKNNYVFNKQNDIEIINGIMHNLHFLQQTFFDRRPKKIRHIKLDAKYMASF